MLFTRQYLSTARQTVSACPAPCATVSMLANNWQAAVICVDQVGTSSVQSSFPGNGNNGEGRARKSGADMLVQILFTMKNARKQLGETSNDPTQIKPGPIITDNPDAFPVIENQLFYEKPIARQPESADFESFRSWLKNNLPRHKASPALMERISRITQDDNA